MIRQGKICVRTEQGQDRTGQVQDRSRTGGGVGVGPAGCRYVYINLKYNPLLAIVDKFYLTIK